MRGENVHVMSLPAEQVNVKCRVSLAVLGHRTHSQCSDYVNLSVITSDDFCLSTAESYIDPDSQADIDNKRHPRNRTQTYFQTRSLNLQFRLV